MKNILFCFFVVASSLVAQEITGVWKSIDEDSGMARCIVAVYEYEGLCYGRMIATCDDDGKVKETIYTPIEKAPGVVGNPPYCGLDFIYDLADAGHVYKGKILDPSKGDVYKCELWVEAGNLIVRGKLWIFGRSQIWLPASMNDFPKGFKMPNIAAFVPKIPEVN